MVRAKNYETASKFVKVMQRKLWPVFFRDTVYVYRHVYPPSSRLCLQTASHDSSPYTILHGLEACSLDK